MTTDKFLAVLIEFSYYLIYISALINPVLKLRELNIVVIVGN